MVGDKDMAALKWNEALVLNGLMVKSYVSDLPHSESKDSRSACCLFMSLSWFRFARSWLKCHNPSLSPKYFCKPKRKHILYHSLYAHEILAE